MFRLPSPLPALVAALALLVTACGGSDDVGGSDPNARGYKLYQKGACHTCHGPGLAGSQLGPPLKGLEQHWDEESLVQMLLDPQGVIDRTPRLRERRGMYIMKMPPATQAGLSREQIRELAAWLLSGDREP